MKNGIFKLSIGIFTGIMLTSKGLSADFTVEELHKAALAATTTFKSDYEPALHDAIYGIQVTKGRDSGKVKLFYRTKNNEPKSIEYFCHYHTPGELDCHEH